MTLPLESLKLTPVVMGTPLNWLQPALLTLGGVMLFMGALYFILLFMETYKKHMRPLLNDSLWIASVLTIIGTVIIVITPYYPFQYTSALSIENISVTPDDTKVTFKTSGTLYAATLPKDQSDLLSDCKIITAKRMSSRHSDTIRLGAFTLDSQDNICTLKGINK